MSHFLRQPAWEATQNGIDTAAGWTKSGWHGWVYGWKLHLICTVGAVWIPLAATLTPATEADNVQALPLLEELPQEVRFVLGDQQSARTSGSTGATAP